jgi:hypothetical protein
MAAALCCGSHGGGAQLALHHQAAPYDTDMLIGALEPLPGYAPELNRVEGLWPASRGWSWPTWPTTPWRRSPRWPSVASGVSHTCRTRSCATAACPCGRRSFPSFGAEQQVQEWRLDLDVLALADHERRVVEGDDLKRRVHRTAARSAVSPGRTVWASGRSCGPCSDRPTYRTADSSRWAPNRL